MTAKSDDAIKLDEAKPDTDKSEPAANVEAEIRQGRCRADDQAATTATETAKADDTDTSDEPKGGKKNAGKMLARIMDELGDGDGPVKVKRSGKTCKVDAPFVGVVSFPCDGDKD